MRTFDEHLHMVPPEQREAALREIDELRWTGQCADLQPLVDQLAARAGEVPSR